MTVDNTNDKNMVKWTTKSEQAHISMTASDMNTFRICFFSEIQNCIRKLLIEVFDCTEFQINYTNMYLKNCTVKIIS